MQLTWIFPIVCCCIRIYWDRGFPSTRCIWLSRWRCTSSIITGTTNIIRTLRCSQLTFTTRHGSIYPILIHIHNKSHRNRQPISFRPTWAKFSIQTKLVIGVSLAIAIFNITPIRIIIAVAYTFYINSVSYEMGIYELVILLSVQRHKFEWIDFLL